MNLIRRVIREVLTAPSAPITYDDRVLNAKKAVHKKYFDKNKAITFCRKYIQKYGFIGVNGVGTSTYERLLGYLERDPDLDDIQTDYGFCADFMSHMKQARPTGMDSAFIQKVKSVLHSSMIKVEQLKLVLPAVSKFMQQESMTNSKPIETGEQMIFFKLKLKKVTKANDSLVFKPFDPRTDEADRFTFQDQKGNYLLKRGAPPSIYMRTQQGKGKLLANIPYEMHVDDLYTFKGKISKTFTNKAGAIVNVIDSVQPI